MLIVITINYNLHQHTIPCVYSVLEADYSDMKVFLVDNGSREDDYNELVKEFSNEGRVNISRIVKNRGYVGAVNFGLEAAAQENPAYYLIMNNDTFIDKQAIGELVSAAQRHQNRAIVSGKVYYHDEPDVLQHTGVIFTDKRFCTTSYPGRNEKDTGQFEEELERDSLDDVFWLIPNEVFRKVGYYCNYFYLYAEQGDYAQRARKLGYKLIFTPGAKLWHKESMTTGGGNPKALPIQYWRGKGSFIFLYRHVKKHFFIMAVLKFFLKHCLKALFAKKPQRQLSAARLRGYLAGMAWLFHRKPDTGDNPYLKNE